MKITITDTKIKVRCEKTTYTIVLPKQNKDNVVAKTISHAIKSLDNMVKKAKQHEAVKQTQDRISTLTKSNIPPAPEPMFKKGGEGLGFPNTCVNCNSHFKPTTFQQLTCGACGLPSEIIKIQPTPDQIFIAKSHLDIARHELEEKKKQTYKDK
jgi:hypothetical protein